MVNHSKKNTLKVKTNEQSMIVVALEDLLFDNIPFVQELFSNSNTLSVQKYQKSYPLLYIPRNPVRFIDVPGTVHLLANTKSLSQSFQRPVRFTRLRHALKEEDPGEIMTEQECDKWARLLTVTSSYQRSLHLVDGNHIGLQSGGRSALRFLADGTLLRIKGGEYQSQLHLFDEVPNGSSIEFYVQREIRNYNLLRKRAPESLFAYTPSGWYDYEKEYHGDKLIAGLFIVKGDTRLDEVLTAFAAIEWTMESSGLPMKFKNKFLEHIDEVSFILGRIAGIRLKQIEQTGIPWSRRTGNSNAHIGNMVLYNEDNKTTIGIVDLDAAGGFMKSAQRKQDVIKTQYSQILRDTNEPVSISSAIDSPLHNRFYPRKGYSAAAQGFVEGYHHGGSETINTLELITAIAAARSVDSIIDIERQKVMYGIGKRYYLANVTTRDYKQWEEEKKTLCEEEGLFPKYKNRKHAP